MTVRIVTDSGADLPPEIARQLGIAVVPLCVRFGDKVYRDRLDISEDEFYHRLQHDPAHPNTTQPTPNEFLDIYRRLSEECDGIVSIHLSSKLSGTYNSAVQARDSIKSRCPIEVVDSQTLTMGLGLLDILAARAAAEGKGIQEITEEARRAVPDIHLLALFDTLKYLLMGGRIGKAKALLGSIINVKPMLTLKDGETMPAGQARTRSKGIEKLLEFVKSATEVQESAVIYTTMPDEAQSLAERISSITGDRPIISRLGPALGAHIGPGALIVVFRGKTAALA